jgi:hypothetical protein
VSSDRLAEVQKGKQRAHVEAGLAAVEEAIFEHGV